MTLTTITAPIRLLLTGVLSMSLTLIMVQGMAQSKKPAAVPSKSNMNSLSYKIIDAAHGTYGYDIYRGSKMFIHQPSIPGLQGNDGFASKARAEKVATLVVQKIQKGEMPPTTTVAEMKKLKAM